LLVVVLRPGQQVGREELLAHFTGKVAKWWLPDDVVFAEALPVGGTGKIQKNKLRERYRDYQLPTA
jgi:fatty-acyl-CoA synthase